VSALNRHSDELLLEAWRRGDVAAFDELHARYQRPLFGFILRLLGGAGGVLVIGRAADGLAGGGTAAEPGAR
jgi:hypothetical protein